MTHILYILYGISIYLYGDYLSMVGTTLEIVNVFLCKEHLSFTHSFITSGAIQYGVPMCVFLFSVLLDHTC